MNSYQLFQKGKKVSELFGDHSEIGEMFDVRPDPRRKLISVGTIFKPTVAEDDSSKIVLVSDDPTYCLVNRSHSLELVPILSCYSLH